MSEVFDVAKGPAFLGLITGLVTAFVTLSEGIEHFNDLRYRKARFEALKLRYEIEALRKEHELEEVQIDDISRRESRITLLARQLAAWGSAGFCLLCVAYTLMQLIGALGIGLLATMIVRATAADLSANAGLVFGIALLAAVAAFNANYKVHPVLHARTPRTATIIRTSIWCLSAGVCAWIFLHPLQNGADSDASRTSEGVNE